MRTIRFKGGATNTRGRFTAGETLTGKEKDLKPLVDSGAAEWVEDKPAPKPRKRSRKKGA